MAHRQPGQRAGRADLVLRPQLRAVQPVLLRPDRSRAAARPGVHPARRADGHQPGPRPARRPGLDPGRDQPLGAALAHRPRPVRRGHRERGRRGAAVARGAAGASRRAQSRAVDQLAWTLRQVPGIERVRITVGGATVPLSGGRIDAPVTSGAEFDAGGPADAELWGLRGGRVVDLRTTSGSARWPAGPHRLLDAQPRGQRVAPAGGCGLRRRDARCSWLRPGRPTTPRR